MKMEQTECSETPATKFRHRGITQKKAYDFNYSVNINSFEIKWNANLMQLGNFIDVFLTRHVSGTHAHHQEN